MTSAASAFTPAQIDRKLVWRYIFAGLSASLVSIGLARFGFTPLIPELIREHWFSTSSVIYLGAANLAGYLCGALLARPLGNRLGNERTLRAMMLLITATFLACAFPLSVSWYFFWRALSGIAGGVVMVLVAATILPHVPPSSKGKASGAIFLGLGLGIAGTGTIIPLLLRLGLAQTWIGLAIVSAVLTAASWFAWPSAKLSPASQPLPAGHVGARTHFGWRIKLLYAQYALLAASVVSPMVFLVDYIARGLGMGTQYGAVFWVLYGVGAIAGPPLYGLLADRMGARNGIRLVASVQIAALLGVYLTENPMAVGVLTVLIGTFAPGIVPIVLARVHELVPKNAPKQNIVWSRATTLSAGVMAGAGYAFSALFNASGGNHRLVFLAAALLVIVAMGGEVGALFGADHRADDGDASPGHAPLR
ncbi:MFS transporter [Bordetella genomosp. 9]|uniref:YbfB/YjiJ family MFS transporter n=1 Tax=Bordetella genomosp. 9 TaxID=1416803 RepID=UPI000A292B1F|nr:YbfB/YjiJ family MFS transporter [Bordetella genomosp. 9]ARP90396.1 MFS transporter [Bordetella genomosp. 9]